MQLYNQYCNGMLAVANRYIDNTMEAEDVVQDAFIKAFSKLEQYKAEVSFGAWLKRIVINRCIDVLKSKHQRMVELEDFHLNVIADYNENDWEIEKGITVENVNQEIEKLPEKYKYVVLLYLVEGYDHQEISEILNITEVASRTQLSRGKQKLKNALKLKRNEARY
ncbi:sigma-70 family RNA polymerase sigma factor [Winogradskyella litoriviva]|uniref:RNA polymerase sigma factor n=1 Tax=Winogradskyella litoriviva TaxID=1220182 RepID=A0ABX2E6L1_9FLAO|nr:sigma-70 family RNA polymerase sigma factor [Winogradskyella litoriviva]NRD24163.1 sigma-70 family RNA polymerase sigma factor [Winogradskyella litoriviva]